MGNRYSELLAEIPGIELPLLKTDYADNLYWVYGLVLQDQVPCTAEEMMRRLAEQKIGTRPFFWCMHEQPVFRRMNLFEHESCPVAERIARRGFYIPSGLALTDEQMQRVANALHNVMREVMQ